MRGYIIGFLLACSLCLCACGQTQESPEDVLGKARLAFDQARYLEAERGYEDYLRYSPKGANRLEAWTRLAGIAENIRNDPEAALSLLDAAILEFSSSPSDLVGLMMSSAVLYEQIRQWDKAAEVNERLLALKVLSPVETGLTQQRLARALQNMGQYDSADRALSACLAAEVNPEVKKACQFSLIRNAALIADTDRAKAILETALADPDLPSETRAIATFNLADLLEKEGDKTRSRELFKSILEVYPNRAAVEARLNN